MVDEDLQFVLSVMQGIGDVKCPDGTTHQFLGILATVEGDGSVGADALKLQEVTLVGALVGVKNLVIYSRAMQVAMTQLTVAVIVVEVVGDVDVCCD